MSAPGRVRTKLARLLEVEIERQLGLARVSFDASNLWSSRSPERYYDDRLGTWGGPGTACDPDWDSATPGLVIDVGSHATMTECVRNGIVLSWRGRQWCSGIDVAPVAAVVL